MTATLRECEIEPRIVAHLQRVDDVGWVEPGAMLYGAHRQLFVNGRAILQPKGKGLVKIERKETGLDADFGCVPDHRVRKMHQGDCPIRIHSYQGLRCDG